jgi:hypothetical protein
MATPPMEVWDYEIRHEDARVRLLDDDGKPDSGLCEADQVLARIAAAMHADVERLSPQQIEQTVIWLKTWKHRDRPTGRAFHEFEAVLKALRDSPEQLELQRAATKRIYVGHGLFFLAAGSVAGGIAAAVLASWWAAAGFIVGAFGLLLAAEQASVAAIKLGKEQEQRYLWDSIRKAATVQEINRAGIFAFAPGTTWTRHSSEDAILLAMRAERERLTDALYFDPDDYLKD